MQKRLRTVVVCLAIQSLVIAPSAWAADTEPQDGPGIFEPFGGVLDRIAQAIQSLFDTDPVPPSDDPPPPPDPDPDDEQGSVMDPGG